MHILYTKLIVIIYLLIFKPMQALDAPPPAHIATYQSTITTITTTSTSKHKFTLMNQWLSYQYQQQQQQQQEQQVAVGNNKPSPNIQNHETTFFKPQLLTNDDIMKLKFDQNTDLVGPTRQDEGSFCRRSFDGRSGYCILAYQCLHIIHEYRVHGTKLDVCNYKRKIPVICCPLDDKHIDVQRISAMKCQEYNSAAKGIKLDSPKMFSGKQCVSSVPMIVGGVETQIGEFPHMAALGWTLSSKEDIKWGCGGALVSESFVMTAAHCATSGSKPPDIIRLGMEQLNQTNPWQQDIKVLIIILHPKYRSSSYYHDIALMKLAKPATLNVRVRPACLWQLPDLHTNKVIAAGWGRTEFLGPKSNVLQKVDLDVIDQKLCKELYNSERRQPRGIIDEQFCAGYLPGGKDTCQGDSGGPLHSMSPEYNCISFVVGITSFGKFCAAPNAPGVYTRIYSYLDWIEKIVFRV